MECRVHTKADNNITLLNNTFRNITHIHHLRRQSRTMPPTVKRSMYVPSLPLELWILIFFQNTDPSHLYTVCRQVCSAWRTEIPKVIAKKYLEDPVMVQIHSDCATSKDKRFTCLLGPELGFSHYKGTGNDRVVFKPTYKGPAEPDHHEDECTTLYTRAKNRGSRSLDDLRLPIAHDHRRHFQQVGGKYVDLPPCQIRIKWVFNDTELPGLKVDFAKGEISFEWQPMLELFYREAAVLDRHDSLLATEAMKWLNEEDRSIAAVLVRTWKDRAARESRRMGLRRERIKDWYRNVHNHKHSGRFDATFEDMASRAFRNLEWPGRCIRPPCAEDEDEKKTMKLRYEAYNALRIMDNIVYRQKVPKWNAREIAGYWETLATGILFAETPVDEHRCIELFRTLQQNDVQPLFNEQFDHEDYLHPSVQSAYWAKVQNSLKETDYYQSEDYRSEDLSTKAKLYERHEKEKCYARFWLGKSRV
jgi:hypothetical protein